MTKDTVLIPLDGSEMSRRAIPFVRNLFKPEEHQLILLRVDDEPRGVVAAPRRSLLLSDTLVAAYETSEEAEVAAHPIYASQAWDSREAQLTAELRAIACELEAEGYAVSTEVRFGEPADEIVEAANSLHVDLVAMATHGRTGLSRLVLGSVAEAVLRRLTLPVLLVRSGGVKPDMWGRQSLN